MFGSIMGTLQTFVRDENRGKERDLKKREIEKKIEQVYPLTQFSLFLFPFL